MGSTENLGIFTRIGLLSALFLVCLIPPAVAQTPSPTPSPAASGPTSILSTRDDSLLKREFIFSGVYSSLEVKDEKLVSRLMGREMPYQVIVPLGYPGAASERYPVIFLLHGLLGSFNNWTSKTDLAKFASAHRFIIVTPEGGNGWYCDNSAKSSDQFESYIIKELIPEIDKRYRTLPNRRGIAGLSMGGYGAIKFGLKYPELFVVAGSFSGVINAASVTERDLPGGVGKSIEAIFGPAGSDTRKGNDPFALVRQASAEKIRSFPFLYLDCGTEDILCQSTRTFADLLFEKGVRHEYRQLPGAHDWKFWNKQVKEFLDVAETYLAQN